MLRGMRGSTIFGIVLGIALLVSLVNSLSGRGDRRDNAQGSRFGGSGRTVSEMRDVGSFNAINLTSVGDVTVTLGDEPSLEVRAPENLLANLQTEVEDDTLTIRTRRNTRFPRGSGVSYRVVTPSLERLELSGVGDIRAEKVEGDEVVLGLSGSGDLYVEDLRADGLEADLSGAGDMQLSGSVSEQTVTVSGVGTYQACALGSEDAEVDVSGAGDAFVQATDNLDASVSGVGDVRYRGDPEVSADVSGVGSVSRSGRCQQP